MSYNYSRYFKGTTIVIAMLGMLSPSSRGALVSTMMFLFVFMGIFAGYYSAKLYKSMKGKGTGFLSKKTDSFITV